MSKAPIPPGPYDLNARLSADRRGRLAVVPAECYERERNRATAAEARIAALEADQAEANIAVGLTGYDHREDVTTPAQCIYALWADHTNLRELHAMQGAAITSLEADLAAAREREAALAGALKTMRDYAATTFEYWDSDADMKVGKRLMAMGGLRPNYEPHIDAALAALEADQAEANIAVGLTGYDHREDVTTPAQCIYALWADHTKLRAELAAVREREAALAAQLHELKSNFRRFAAEDDRWSAVEWLDGLDATTANAILAAVRREAKREALEALEAATPAPPELSEDHDERMHSDNGGDIRDAAYNEGYRDARMGDLNRIGAALVALDAEEAQNG